MEAILGDRVKDIVLAGAGGKRSSILKHVPIERVLFELCDTDSVSGLDGDD